MIWLIVSIALLSLWSGIFITECTYAYLMGQDSIQPVSKALNIISTGSFMGGIFCLVTWLVEII